jgi:hypothetical protein
MAGAASAVAITEATVGAGLGLVTEPIARAWGGAGSADTARSAVASANDRWSRQTEDNGGSDARTAPSRCPRPRER